jgi:hypothetical protein
LPNKVDLTPRAYRYDHDRPGMFDHFTGRGAAAAKGDLVHAQVDDLASEDLART